MKKYIERNRKNWDFWETGTEPYFVAQKGGPTCEFRLCGGGAENYI